MCQIVRDNENPSCNLTNHGYLVLLQAHNFSTPKYHQYAIIQKKYCKRRVKKGSGTEITLALFVSTHYQTPHTRMLALRQVIPGRKSNSRDSREKTHEPLSD